MNRAWCLMIASVVAMVAAACTSPIDSDKFAFQTAQQKAAADDDVLTDAKHTDVTGVVDTSAVADADIVATDSAAQDATAPVDAGPGSDTTDPKDATTSADASAECVIDDDCLKVLKKIGGCKKAACVKGLCKAVNQGSGAACHVGGNLCKPGKCDGSATCVAGAPPDCDDANACTDDACQAMKGCAHAKNSIVCDDGNVCSVDDYCDNGACKAGAKQKDCDDKNPCTDDKCQAGKGCVFENNTAQCEDKDGCTVGDVCAAGACKAGQPKACADGDTCTKNECDPKTGKCLHPAATGKVCDDGDKCTTGSACDSKAKCSVGKPKCSGGGCNDGACDPASGKCGTKPKGEKCDDGDKCTSGDLCDGKGKCGAGKAKTCPPSGKPCQVDKCNAKTGNCGPVPAPNGSACKNANKCVLKPSCKAGKCVGTALKCDDGNVCTADSCDKAKGCVHDGLAMIGKGCEDGNKCTTGDFCGSSTCKAGKAKFCDDSNPCTKDACDSKTGKCATPAGNDGETCDDGDACTNSSCKAGKCTGKPKTCDDKNTCTLDECKFGKCKHYDQTGGNCVTGKTCDAPGTCKAGQCNSGGDKLFDKGYTTGKNLHNWFRGVAQFDDGGHIAVGEVHNNPGGPGGFDGWALRTDTKGDVVWGTFHGWKSADRYYNVEVTANGIFAVGYARPSNYDRMWVTKLDPTSGKGVVHAHHGETNKQYYGHALAAAKDGSLYLCGYASSPAGGHGGYDAVVVRIDGKNPTKAIWTKPFGSTSSDYCMDIVVTAAGPVFVGQSALPGKSYDLWLAGLDSAGNLLWQQHHGGTSSDHGTGLVALSDGFAVSGYTTSKGAGSSDAWVVRTDTKGKLLWDRIFGGMSYDYGEAIVALQGDDVAMAGRMRHPTSGKYHGFATRLSSKGVVKWSKSFFSGDNEHLHGMAASKDDGLVLVGDSGSKGGDKYQDGWMMRTDAWGHTTCKEAAGCAAKDASACDDKNPCTVDLCSAAKGCHHPTLAGAGVAACDGSNWSNHCYKAVKASANWHEAEKACVTWGGHLASIHSLDEQSHIQGQVTKSCGAGTTTLIGLNDIKNEGVWLWSDGSAYNFSNWNAGEPNDGGTGIKTQDASALLSTGKWDDGETLYKYGCYACKRASPVTCSDGNACTTADLCNKTGKCVGKTQTCSDGKKCSNGVDVEQVYGTKNLPIQDNHPKGSTDALNFPDRGIAQKLDVLIDISNSNIGKLKVSLIDPKNIEHVLYAGGGGGKTLKTSYPSQTKPVSGDLSKWVGKNPKGEWSLKVVDSHFLNNGYDGQVKSWSVRVETESSDKFVCK